MGGVRKSGEEVKQVLKKMGGPSLHTVHRVRAAHQDSGMALFCLFCITCPHKEWPENPQKGGAKRTWRIIYLFIVLAPLSPSPRGVPVQLLCSYTGKPYQLPG